MRVKADQRNNPIIARVPLAHRQFIASAAPNAVIFFALIYIAPHCCACTSMRAERSVKLRR
jgi:hypothetical protein